MINNTAASYSAHPVSDNPIPADLLTLPEETNKPSLRIRFNALMLGYLALNNFSDDPRWITVVTSQAIDQQSYKALLGDKVRLRIIRAKQEDLLWITWQCLAQGNSFAVISTLENLSEGEHEQLQMAAGLGNCTYHPV